MKNDNELIAQFMGVEKSDRLYKDHFTFVGDDLAKAGLPFICGIMGNCMDKPPFATSWDWLMPVVEKIYNLKLEDEPVLVIKDQLADANLFETHAAVVEFIKWWQPRIKRFNSVATLAFSVEHSDMDNPTAVELLAGLNKRFKDLQLSGNEIIEACGGVADTMEVDKNGEYQSI